MPLSQGGADAGGRRDRARDDAGGEPRERRVGEAHGAGPEGGAPPPGREGRGGAAQGGSRRASPA